MARDKKREQSVGEEIANSITHGVGFLLSCACLSVGVVLAVRHSSPKVITSVAIYGAMMCLLYLSSTLYHAMPSGSRAKRIFNIFDHCSIYLLIAGTYTPIALGNLGAAWGWSLFGVIWGLALIGIVFQSLFIHKYQKLSTLTYLAMGWVVVVAIKQVWNGLGPHGFMWILTGGICYSIGTIFYVQHRMRYAHAIWHLFVLAGSITHFFGILFHVVLK